MAADPESLRKPLAAGTKINALKPKEPESFPWLPAIAFVFLSFNCIQAVYRARDDLWTVSFVVSAYSALVLLFWCLQQLERLPRDGTRSREEGRLKMSVWVLAMLLNFMFSYRVAAMMPPVLAAVIWAVASATTLAAFYAFFIYHELDDAGTAPDVPSGKA